MKTHFAFRNAADDHFSPNKIKDYAMCGYDLRGGLGRTGTRFSAKNFSETTSEVTCQRCRKNIDRIEADGFEWSKEEQRWVEVA